MDGGKTLTNLDRFGMLLSFGCAVHCMAMPFILTLLPLVGLSMFSHSAIDMLLFIFTIGVAATTLCWGVRTHGNWKMILFVVAALVFFTIGGFHTHDLQDALFVACGGLCLVAGHWMNLRLCRSCQACAHAAHS